MQSVLYTQPWLQDTTYKGGTLHYQHLDGIRIAYHDSTHFLVQVGRNRKGSYKTKYLIKGNLEEAVMLYMSINLGRSYKKRLLMPASSRNRGVLACQASYL